MPSYPSKTVHYADLARVSFRLARIRAGRWVSCVNFYGYRLLMPQRISAPGAWVRSILLELRAHKNIGADFRYV